MADSANPPGTPPGPSAETAAGRLSHWRARLTAPQGRQKLDALLGAEDPAAAVAALPVAEVYHIVHDVGFHDAQELVALATPEQIRGCLDLDTWDRDRFLADSASPWLAALVEAGPDKLAQVWERLDSELTALLLARHTVVYDLSLGEEPDDQDFPEYIAAATDSDPDPPGPDDDSDGPLDGSPDDLGPRPIILTPDTYFALKITTDHHDTIALISRLIDDLYRADPSGQLARHTIMAARSEPVAQLEEMSFRWRAGRMADLGYADFYDALEVFRPLDPESITVGEASEDRFGPEVDASELPGPLPAPIAERVAFASFLAKTLDRIDDPDEVARLENAFMILLNRVLSAARVSPSDREAQSIAAEHAAATVSLALEHLTGRDLARAEVALRTVSLVRLHRAGHTLTLRLARLARALAPRLRTAAEPVPTILSALLSRRPFFARELDDPPGDGPRPFTTMVDIKRIAEELSILALRIAIADLLAPDPEPATATTDAEDDPEDEPGIAGLDLPDPELPDPELDDRLRTALVRAALDEPLEATPLDDHDLERFAATLDGEHLGAEVRERAGAALLDLLDRSQVHAARHLLPRLLASRFAQLAELARLVIEHRKQSSGPLDRRHVAGVLLTPVARA